MPVRRQIPVQVVPVWAVLPRTVTMAMSVPMTRVILEAAASIPTTQQPVMTVMPVRRQIPALPVPVWAVLPRTAMMGMSVPMTPVIL